MSVNTCYRHAAYTQCLRLPIRPYVSSFAYICVLILLYICPHTAICYRHAAYTQRLRSYICVLIRIYMCPHTAIYVSSLQARGVHATASLLYMCPHSPICVSSYCYISALILLSATGTRRTRSGFAQPLTPSSARSACRECVQR